MQIARKNFYPFYTRGIDPVKISYLHAIILITFPLRTDYIIVENFSETMLMEFSTVERRYRLEFSRRKCKQAVAGKRLKNDTRYDRCHGSQPLPLSRSVLLKVNPYCRLT